MIERKIQLSGMTSVKEFVACTERQSFDVDVGLGRHMVDAKSILGIFSLNIEAPLLLRVHSNGGGQEAYLEQLAAWLLPEEAAPEEAAAPAGSGVDVAALGELLIDFTPNGESAQGNALFEANPGGAPCNVLAMLAKLGKRPAFLGKVGDDIFGRQLKGSAQGAGIDVRGLVLDPAVKTTLAFVQLKPDGDREFSFYRDPGADELLRPDELDERVLSSARIFHFGSLSLTRDPARSATRRAVELAKKAGALVSFDPNLRPLLWPGLEMAREQMLWGCSVCDILKVAEEELQFLTGETEIAAGVAALRGKYPNLRLMTVTKGKTGSEAFYRDLTARRPTFGSELAVDTTGAGDTFCGCCLDFVLDHGLDGLTQEDLEEMLSFANAAAALVTRKKGALRSMPEKETVRELLEQ